MGLFGRNTQVPETIPVPPPEVAEAEKRADGTEGVEADTSTVQFDDALLIALLGGSASINKEQAMQIPTVRACIGLIADRISALPIKLYEETAGEVKEITDDKRLRLLNGDTGDTLNATELKKRWIIDYFLGKGAYTYILRDAFGAITGLYYVDESAVSVIPKPDPIFKQYYITVNGKTYFPHEFLKILRNSDGKGRGKSIVEENPTILAIAYNTMKFENMLVRKGGNKRGFIEAEKKLSPDAISVIKEAWARLYANSADNADNIVVLNDGAKFHESSNTSVEMQLNQNKVTNAREICKLVCMPPEIISGGASENAQSLCVQNCFMPIINTIEAACDKDLLLETEKGRRYFAFDTAELTRGDFTKRMQGYLAALQGNIMQLDEVREREDLKPLGFNYIKLGLQDVLLNPETGEVYTPNMDATANLNRIGEKSEGENEENFQKGLDNGEKRGIMKSYLKFGEMRGNPNHDPRNGRFTNGMSVKLPDGGYGKLANDGKVTKIVTFAGGNSGKPVKVADYLSQQYGGNPNEWKHLRGNAVVENNNKMRPAEVHWFENGKTVIKMKVKRWRDES